MRNIGHFACALVPLLFASSLFADEGRRQLGSHVHGQGSLDIAIEDNKISLDLMAPGMDVAGFEHEAKSNADTAAVEKALTALGQGTLMFKFPSQAECRVDKADAKREDEHDGDKGHKDGDDKAEHAQFHAEYQLTCAAPQALNAIEANYFKVFPAAQLLNVSIVTSKGQTQTQISRDKPIIDLGGLM